MVSKSDNDSTNVIKGLKQTKSAASTQNSERNVSSSCMSVHAFMLILAVKKNGDRYGKLTISGAAYNQQDEVFTTTIAMSAVVSCPEPPPPRGLALAIFSGILYFCCD